MPWSSSIVESVEQTDFDKLTNQLWIALNEIFNYRAAIDTPTNLFKGAIFILA